MDLIREQEVVPLEQTTLLGTLLGAPSAAPSCQPTALELVLWLVRLREPVRSQDLFGRSLAGSGCVKSRPILSVLGVKRLDGLLLLGVEVQFLHGHLKSDILAGNAGR